MRILAFIISLPFVICRKVARAIFVATVLGTGAVLLVWGAAQTPAGAHFLSCGVCLAVERLSGGAVSVRGVQLDLAGRVRVSRLEVDGGAAGGLEASGLDVAWDYFRLARGDAHILRLAAARVAVRAGAPAAPAPDAPPAALAMPPLPAWLPGVIVDELAIRRLELTPATGTPPPALRIAGSAVAAPRDLTFAVNVHVTTLEGPVPATAYVALSARQSPRTLLDVSARLAAEDATLTTTATIDPERRSASGQTQLTAHALARLARFAGPPLDGKLNLTSTWTASPTTATAHLEIAGTRVHAPRVLLDGRTALDVRLELADGKPGPVTVEGTGEIAALDVDDRALFVPAHPARFTLTAARPREGAASARVTLTDHDAHVALAVQEVAGGADVQTTIDGRELGRRPLLAALNAAAAVKLDARITARAAGPAFTWDGRVSSKDIVTGPMAPVLARGVALSGRAVLQPDATWSFKDCKLATDRIDAGTSSLTQVAVGLAGTASPAGVLADVELSADVHGAARATPRGRLTATVRATPAEVTAERIVLTLAGARVEGRLAKPASAAFPTAHLSGKTADLAPLLALAGVVARGAAELELGLDTAGGPRLRAQVTARGLETGPHRVGAAHVTATVTHLTTTPDLQATAKLERVTSAENRVEELTLQAKGTPALLAVVVDASGGSYPAKPAAPHTFDLHIATRVAHAAPTTRVTLDAVRLRADAVPVVLTQPATLVFAPARVDIPTLVLTVGTTTIKTNLRTDGAQIVAGLLAERIPLALASPGVSGTASALVKLDGTLADPRVSLRVLAKSVRAAAGTPPLDLDVTGGFGEGVLESRVSIAGITEKPVIAAARLPVTFALKPFVARLEPDGALSANVVARAELSRLVRVLGLDLARAAGVLALDAKISGTPAAPHVEGLARLTGGHLENPASGTVLSAITAEIVADGQDVTLRSLTATDGKDGRLEAHGTARLDGAHMPVDLTVDLKNLRLIHHDLLSVQSGGSLAIRGDRRRLGVTGTLDLGEVLATISRNLPPDAAVVPYEIVDGPDGEIIADVRPGAATPAPKSGPALPIDLDVAVKLIRPAKVTGEGLDTEWTGALNVRGQADRPDVTGTLTLKRGEMAFLGQKLAMNTGSLVFSGGSPPIPAVDILVQRTASGKTVGVHVEGRATAPKISLTSDPAMPDDEILSQIVFKQDIGSISPVQGVMLAQATLAMARGSLGGGLMDKLGGFSPTALLDKARGALAVDRFNVGTDSVNVGKYVREGVYVGVEKGPGAAEGQVAVEAALKGGFTLESKMDARSQGSFGLSWSREY